MGKNDTTITKSSNDSKIFQDCKPMILRFVRLCSTIDTSNCQKWELRKGARTMNAFPLIQRDYEFKMFSQIFQRSIEAYNAKFEVDFLNIFDDFEQSGDKVLLLQHVNIINNICYPNNNIKEPMFCKSQQYMDSEDARLMKEQLPQLLNTNEELEESFRVLISLIKKYNFLPLDRSNPAWAVESVPHASDWIKKYIFAVVILWSAMCYILSVFTKAELTPKD